MRTINELSNLDGRVYVYLANAEIGDRFLKQAEAEGFTYSDGVMPTEREYAEIMAVNHDHTINFVGTNGRIAYGAGASSVGGETLLPEIKVTVGVTDRDLTGRCCYVQA